jgi:hypothetical protein
MSSARSDLSSTANELFLAPDLRPLKWLLQLLPEFLELVNKILSTLVAMRQLPL